MKKLKLFFALFAMLALNVGNAWAESIEINTTSSGVNGSYRDYEFDVNSITFGCTQWMKNNNIQAKKSTTNSLYNVDAIPGTITSIVVKQTGTARAIKIYGGTSTKPTTQITSPSTSAEMVFDFTGKDFTYFSLTTPANACYFDKITINYTPAGGGEDPGEGGGEDPVDPTPGAGGTGTINFNSDAVKINAASVTGQDDLNNTWTITTVGTTSFTTNSAYYQVGKGTEPATSITFTTTLPSEGNITAFSAKFGGFNGTAGNVTLLVDETSVGTGNLNGTSDVTVENSSEAIGKTLTVTVTGIAKGVKVYYISYTYTSSGSGSTEPVASVKLTPEVKDFGTVNVGENLSQEFTITTENTAATLSASIDNTTDYAVSAIAGDKVTVTYQPQSAGTHSAVLTVKAGEEATATVNLTGKAVQALEGTWILVTDASSLKAGDEIIIAAKESDVALSTTQASNNRPEVAITKNDNTITATSETQVLTLQAGNKENTLALYTGDGYLYAASSGSNWLRTETTLSDNSSWSIAVAADGTATLIAQGTNTRNTLYYNKNSKIFSCYSTTQQEIALYKNTNGQQLAGLAYTTTKYLTKLGDAFATPALTNPNSLTVTYSSSDDNVATVDNTGTVTIKAAGVVVITAAFAGDASYLEGSAKYTLCVTEHAGTEADSYSVADARRVIDVMETAEGVYATGIVSEIVTAYNSNYGNISYNISADGLTTSDQLQAYRGKSYDGANFTSADDVKVGDEVVIKGTLKKYNTTYEFDENNQLVSLNRTKEQAGLAYAETEHNANVGEDFAEPALTNPNSLSITYSSSNTTLATVDETTGEVAILAAGKVTITASSVADATYAAGTASYNITITDPTLAVASLPFAFNGNKAAIETTAGMTLNGLGSDYSASTAPNSQLKFDGTGDWVVIRFDSEPEKLSYDIKNNSFSGGKFSVQESADGETYTDVAVHTTITDLQSEEYELNSASRYVKFIYTTKSSGNVGLGNISITKADHRQDAGLVWSTENVSITLGDAFTAPTLSNPNGLTLTCTSDNENLATVTNAGVVTLKSGVTGKATITAKFDGNSNYKDATVTCTITVNPKTEIVVILAQYNGQWYALKNVEETTGKVLAALSVNYIGGKLYNVEEADKATIEWQRAAVTDGIIFKNGENYIYGTASSTDLKLSTTECAWTLDGSTYKIGNRTFIYRAQANGFKNYNATTTPGTDDYSALPVVTAPVYATGTIYTRSELTEGNYGTICLPYASDNFTGATFFEVAGKEGNKIVFDEVTALEAGKPYIFLAEATEIKVAQIGTEELTAQRHNSLQGTFSQIDPAVDNVLVGNYMVVNNVIKKCGANCGLAANRAYFIATDLENLGTALAPAPGVRRISMGVAGQNTATGVDQVQGDEVPTKMIINGQLFILRGEKMYDAQGKLVK